MLLTTTYLLRIIQPKADAETITGQSTLMLTTERRALWLKAPLVIRSGEDQPVHFLFGCTPLPVQHE